MEAPLTGFHPALETGWGVVSHLSISLRKLQSITSVLGASRWPLLKRLVSRPIYSEMKFSSSVDECMKGILWRNGREPSLQWHRICFLFSSSPVPPLILLASPSLLTGLLFASLCLFSRQYFKLKSSRDLCFPPSNRSELFDDALSFNRRSYLVPAL